MRICKHFYLLWDYKIEVSSIPQSPLVLVKLPWYMNVFTQILNTSTKQMPSSIKGKEKEKEENTLSIEIILKPIALSLPKS